MKSKLGIVTYNEHSDSKTENMKNYLHPSVVWIPPPGKSTA